MPANPKAPVKVKVWPNAPIKAPTPLPGQKK
jgi:hypothetical protein